MEHVNLLSTLRSRFGSSLYTPDSWFVIQVARGNVLNHQNRHLIECFEFLHGLNTICLLFNISEKSKTASLRKDRARRKSSPSSLLIQCNTHAF